ncbi:hypothetical protein B5X24_HaOG200756 [Helicoverpa armigera]|nr:hypothetical protein B5X24_HaOG200756 [Helicoverpa armigera]
MVLYHSSNLLCGSMIILCAICCAGSHKLFINNLKIVQREFWYTPTYIKGMKKLKIYIAVTTTFFSLAVASVLYSKCRNATIWMTPDIILCYIALLVIEIYVEIRQILESIIIFSYISMLQYSLKCLNVDVLGTRKQYNRLGIFLYVELKSSNFLNVQVEEWAAKYQNILVCSKLLSDCFSNQVSWYNSIKITLQTKQLADW